MAFSQINPTVFSKPSKWLTTQDSSPPLTFREFVTLVNPRYQWYRHCEELAAILQQVADGTITRLMVFMPPRHGKSETVSRLFPAYYLYRYPERFVGLTSYAAELAYTLSRNARDNYQASGAGLRDDARAVRHWETGKGGGLWAAGVGGPITGKGGHLLLIDDPLKNAADAESELVREHQKEWYRSTFSTRAEPGAAIVVVQTRWHEMDLAGWLLSEEANEDEYPEGWHILHLPAIAEEDAPTYPPTCTVYPDWRAPGEPLCPERYPLPRLLALAKRVGTYFWSALFQGRPTSRSGGMFKREWWQSYNPEYWYRVHALQVIQVWDTAFKAKQENDYSVCSTWALMPDGVYVLDVWREKVEFPELKREARVQYARWQPAVVLIEDKASGQSLIQELRRDTGLPIVVVKAEADKVSRAAGVTPYVEALRVFLPEDAAWVSAWIDEHAKFPRVAHDDQVDTTSMALRRLVLGEAGGMDEDAATAFQAFTGY